MPTKQSKQQKTKKLFSDAPIPAAIEKSQPTANASVATHPAVLTPALLAWYQQNRRILPWREDPTPYHVWVSEIMLQQTRVEAVKGYYARFIESLPDLAALAAAEEDVYLKLWEGLGYYSRVRNLHKCAVTVMTDFGGTMPSTAKELEKLPGIGPYTAAALASIAFGEAVPAIDGNFLRVFARMTGYEENILSSGAKKEAYDYFANLMTALPADSRAGNQEASVTDSRICGAKAVDTDSRFYGAEVATDSRFYGAEAAPREGGSFDCTILSNPAGAFNQAIMDLGATVCLPNAAPKCACCPWQRACVANVAGRTLDLPYRPAKKKKAIEDMTVFLIHFGNGVLLRKRPDAGLLAGLYEFPHEAGHLTKEEALRFVETLGFGPLRIKKLPPAKHIFSHKEWHMIAYEIKADQWTDFTRTKPAPFNPDSPQDDGRLFIARREEIQDVWSVPSAFAPYRDYLLGK